MPILKLYSFPYDSPTTPGVTFSVRLCLTEEELAALIEHEIIPPDTTECLELLDENPDFTLPALGILSASPARLQ